MAPSNLFSSLSSVLKARITWLPVNISRDTKFNLSTNFCNILNLGIAIIINVRTIIKIQIIAKPIIQAIDASLLNNTLINPPIAIIGAYTTTLNKIVNSIWICCISFVVRVIKDAVENPLNSSVEKLNTFLNIFSLNVLPSLAATLEDNSIIEIALIIVIDAIPNICKPDIKIYVFCILSVSAPKYWYCNFTSCIAACSTIESDKLVIIVSIVFGNSASIVFIKFVFCSAGIIFIISAKDIFSITVLCSSGIFSNILFLIWLAVSSFDTICFTSNPFIKLIFNFPFSILLISLILYVFPSSNNV